MKARRLVLAVLLSGCGLTACAADFWDMDPPTEIVLDPALDRPVGVTFLQHAADRLIRRQPGRLLGDGRRGHDQGQGARAGEAGANGRHERIPP